MYWGIYWFPVWIFCLLEDVLERHRDTKRQEMSKSDTIAYCRHTHPDQVINANTIRSLGAGALIPDVVTEPKQSHSAAVIQGK